MQKLISLKTCDYFVISLVLGANLQTVARPAIILIYKTERC